MIAFDEFLAEHGQKSADQFVATAKVPHLLVVGVPSEMLECEGFRFQTWTDELGGDTDTQAFCMPSGPSTGASEPYGVIPVRKTSGNTFGMMITLGRTTNNDLVLEDPRISKFHAYFRQLGTQWTLHDAGSKNGTLVEGIHLPQDRNVVLSSGTRILLASVWEFLFLQPEELHAKLQAARP